MLHQLILHEARFTSMQRCHNTRTPSTVTPAMFHCVLIASFATARASRRALRQHANDAAVRQCNVRSPKHTNNSPRTLPFTATNNAFRDDDVDVVVAVVFVVAASVDTICGSGRLVAAAYALSAVTVDVAVLVAGLADDARDDVDDDRRSLDIVDVPLLSSECDGSPSADELLSLAPRTP
jgi:hypothetical protein